MKRLFATMILVTLALGCAPQNKTQKGGMYGAAGGAAAGAIVGQLVGGNTESTLIGAAIGAAVGGASGAGVGYMMDQQEAEFRETLTQSEAAALRREGDLLAITFKADFVFATNSAKVNPGLMPEIERISSVMRNYPQTLIRVEGHTDSTGSEAYNMQLGLRRAGAVRDLLIQNGVAAHRMDAVSYGEERPIATNNTPEGRQLNRRVEIKIAPRQ